MLTPNQIKSHTFIQTRQGFYRAEEVDEYIERVYQTVAELYDTNKQIQKRVSGLTTDLEAYYKGRNSIAEAIIGAQTYASEKAEEADAKYNEIVSDAQNQASQILEAGKQEADEYYAEKTEKANELYSKAETALEKALEKASIRAEQYIADINKKASDIITGANEQASKIVSRAFGDAQRARETCDEIIDGANKVLPSVSQDIAFLKIQLEETFNNIMSAVEAIDVPDEISIEKEAIDEADYEYKVEPMPQQLVFDMMSDDEDAADDDASDEADEEIPDEPAEPAEEDEVIEPTEEEAEVEIEPIETAEEEDFEEAYPVFEEEKKSEIDLMFDQRLDINNIFDSSED